MCFSAEADLAAGLVVGAIGIDALRHADDNKERALAALPIVLAAHQLTEAFVWWSRQDQVAWSVGEAAVWLYLLVAFAVVPVLVPFAIRAVEPVPRRRQVMTALVILGALVATIYIVAMLTSPIGAEVDGNRIVYSIQFGESSTVNALYVLAGCGALLISSHRHIVVFGLLNIAALAGLLWVDSNAKTSLWCAWAAVTSIVISAHVRAHRAETRRSALPRQFA